MGAATGAECRRQRLGGSSRPERGRSYCLARNRCQSTDGLCTDDTGNRAKETIIPEMRLWQSWFTETRLWRDDSAPSASFRLSPTTNLSMTRRIILMTVALAAVAWLYWTLRSEAQAPGDDPLAALHLEAHQPPIDALRALAAEEDRAAAALGESPERVELEAAWSALAVAQAAVATGALSAPPPEAERRMERAVTSWIGRFGPGSFAAAGVAPWRRFRAAIDGLKERSGSAGRGLLEQLAADAPAQQQEVNAACGEFLAFGDSLGVTDATGQLRMSDELLRLVFRYRWLAQARGSRPLHELMTPAELDTFWRWRIEEGARLPPAAVARFVADFVAQRGGYGGVKGGYALPAVFLLRGEPALAYDALLLEQKAHPSPQTEQLVQAVARLGSATKAAPVAR